MAKVVLFVCDRCREQHEREAGLITVTLPASNEGQSALRVDICRGCVQMLRDLATTVPLIQGA